MLTKFRDLLFQNTTITTNEWELIEPKLKLVTYKKNETLHYSGNICDKLRFINSGISRMYYFNEHAKEFTCHISFNDDSNDIIDRFTVDYYSFNMQIPSKYTIEALLNLEVVELERKDFEKLSTITTVFRQLDNHVSPKIHASISDNLMDLNILSNEDRYKNFIAKHKNIYKTIPQYIIASYLGITPVALSRLKNKKNINQV